MIRRMKWVRKIEQEKDKGPRCEDNEKVVTRREISVVIGCNM